MKEHTWSQKQRRIFAGAVIILLLALSGLLGWRFSTHILRLATDPEAFREWVVSYGIAGRFVYMGTVLFQVLIALIPGEPLEIAGGYAFGAVEGTLLCLAACSLGSILIICLVRRFGMRVVTIFFDEEKVHRIRFLQKSPRRVIIFLLIFMIPGTPKDLLCYFAGLTDIPLPALFLICSLGRIPAIVTSTVGGDALGSQSYLSAVVIFAVTFAISCIGLAVYNHICAKNQ